MSSISDFWEDEILDHIFNKGAYTAPTIFVALFTAAPSDAGGGTEVSGTGYARVETEAADWDAASSGALANANDIDFPEAGGSWGTVTHFALFDAASAGNMLMWAALDASQAVASGNIAKFLAGEIDVTLD